jgi:hypothetical protein
LQQLIIPPRPQRLSISKVKSTTKQAILDCMEYAESPFRCKSAISPMLSAVAMFFGVSLSTNAGTGQQPTGGTSLPEAARSTAAGTR